ncbi:MAG: hypothetical protein WC284_12990 [Candidimonas sp.]
MFDKISYLYQGISEKPHAVIMLNHLNNTLISEKNSTLSKIYLYERYLKYFPKNLITYKENVYGNYLASLCGFVDNELKPMIIDVFRHDIKNQIHLYDNHGLMVGNMPVEIAERNDVIHYW